MAEGVRYIKVAKKDKNGVDQSNTLQSLNDLIIPFSSGPITYKILSRSEQPTYFLYYVENPSLEWDDKATLNYTFSGSYTSFDSQLIYTPQITASVDNRGFFLQGGNSNGGLGSNGFPTDSYKIDTYIQKNLHVRISSSLQFALADSKATTTSVSASVRIVSSPFLVGSTPFNPTVHAESLITQSLQNINANTLHFTGSYDLTTELNSGSISSGDCVYFELRAAQNGGEFGSGIFLQDVRTDGIFQISSSATSGPEFQVIPEPFFSQDFSKAFDCQPTFNNIITNRRGFLNQEVDYTSGAYLPTNFDLLINGVALKAEVQDSNYSSLRHITPRYLGSKNQSSNFNVYNSNAGTSSFGTPINIGTYGRTPSVSVLDSTIYEFEYGGGTTPEILGWGGFKLGNILQVSSKDSIRNVKGSEGVTTRLITSKKPEASSTSINYRMVLSDDQTTVIYPPQSVATGSIGSNYFWLTPQTYNDYYQILNGNNPVNHKISLNMYPNQTAGSVPTIPKTTKVVTTEFGVPTISNFALTSSLSSSLTVGSAGVNNYGFIRNDNRVIYLYRNQHISRVTTDDNGFYQGGRIVKPNLQGIVSDINKDLNNGERWFVTLFNEFEFPNNNGNYNSNLSSGSLTPYNVGYSGSDANGNYLDPLAYKGVYEIVGAQDTFTDYTYLLLDKPLFGTRNIGGNSEANTPITPFNGIGSITGPSLGMLIWKARATGLNEFIIVQDEVTGGVTEGAFISSFSTQDVIDNFDYITKTYGVNT